MAHTVSIHPLRLSAQAAPETYDPVSHTVEIVFTTGARAIILDRFGDPFVEELGLRPREVRLGRLNRGAPLLDSHGRPEFRRGGVGLVDQIGVVESAEVDGREGRAVIRFSQRPEVLARGIERDVADGVLRNFSMGYRVFLFRDITQPSDAMPVKRAVDWEPFEISLLPVPQDSGAQVRAASPGLQPCVFEDAHEGADVMAPKPTRKKRRASAAHARRAPSAPVQTIDDDDEPETDPVDETRALDDTTDPAEETTVDDVRDPGPAPRQRAFAPDAPVIQAVTETPDARAIARTAVREERQRTAGIRDAFRSGYLGPDADADELIEEHVCADTSLERVRSIALDLIADAQDLVPTRGIHVGTDESGKRYRGLENALEDRARVAGEDGLTDAGREYRAMSLLRMAEESLRLEGKYSGGMGPSAIALRALTSSDFPQITANVANKSLQAAYDTEERTFTAFAQRSEIPDFKPKTTVQLGSTVLERVPEGGEVRMGTIGDKGETYALFTYAKRLPFTRQAIINDDQSAFDRIPAAMGLAAARTEGDIVYALITGNVVMGEDGDTLFDAAAHGNDATDALDIAGLSAGRASMRRQTDPDGQPINMVPRYLLVNPDLETAAQQLTATFDPNVTSAINPFISQFRAVVTEPRFTSATEWYLAAAGAGVEYAYLRGASGPAITLADQHEVDGVSWRVLHDFGAGVIDFRGLYRGNV